MMKTSLWLAIFILTAVAPAAAGFGQAPAIDRVSVVEGQGYFPVAIRLAGGEILAVVRGGAAHIGRAGRLDLVISRDQGRTWSPPWTVVDGPDDDRNPALGQLADGTILLAYAVLTGYDPDGLKISDARRPLTFDGVFLMRSRDQGKTWSPPERIPAVHSFYGGKGSVSPYGKIIQLKDGTVVMAVYFHVEGTAGHQSTIFRSRDGGKTWGEPTLLGMHFNETAVLEVAEGRLLAAMRSEKGGHICLIQSGDAGKTWNEPVQLTKDLEHPPDLIRLRSGDVLLTYGERNAPMGARAVVSRDGGKTWETDGTTILSDAAPNTDCGYPSSVEIEDGRIVTLYYQVDDLKDVPRSSRCMAARWKIPK